MSLARTLRVAGMALAMLLVLSGAPAFAQKLAGKFYEDPENGYKFKPLDAYTSVPVEAGQQGSGIITQFTSGENQIWVYALYDAKSSSDDEGLTTAGKRRLDIASLLSDRLNGFEGKAKKPISEATVKVKDIEANQRIWELKFGSGEWAEEFYVEAWTFPLVHADIALVYFTDKKRFDKKWRSVVDSSARSFTTIERKAPKVIAVGENASYEELVEAAKQREAKNPGWRVVETPSKKFIIVTSCEKPNFLDEVIKRLEGSRLVFEADFPPPPDFKSVSIVRICATEEEFHQYGGTGGGVAGWFSPTTTELVLYDAVNIDRNMTYAVVVHESFHQYCHFLFGQAEAHRWFDEGHGDYYGGLAFETSRPKITSKMPSGLNRLDEIREMVRGGTYKPVQDHVNFDHQRWQSQGPSNVSCYAQSWSIIYYLRQGAEGKVARKYWKKEYADIIPSYVKVLTEGYRAAFEEILEMRRKEAEKKGEDPTKIDTRINRMAMFAAFGTERQEKIWREAMAASWGKVDIDQFEQDWVTFVNDALK